LDFGPGVSVRLDTNSTVRLASADRLVLEQGALYVDAGAGHNGGNDALKIESVAGSVRHLGTQYQVRAIDAGIVVSVREGRVEITGEQGTNVGSAGERLHVSVDGNIQRSRITSQDASWDWAENAAPGFEIADQQLAAFLAWAARETGRKLIYDSAQAEALAHSVRLRGSIAGLSADAALAAVLPTTNLRLHQAEADSLRIGLGSD
jgi:ferric-dicitrate binding protein FerR (iron transport regulator)